MVAIGEVDEGGSGNEEIYGVPPKRPPLPTLVRAPCHSVEEQPALVPLARAEQGDYDAALDLAYFWAEHVDPERLCNSLSEALALYPCCAGRFVQREVLVEPSSGVTVKEARICILCNNAGVGFSSKCCDGNRPPVMGPLVGLFDRAVGVSANAQAAGPPLLRVKLLDYEDGQILALSFAQGLADAAGIGMFLQAWSKIHHGQNPGFPSDDSRIILEGAINNGFPFLESEYSLLYRKQLSTQTLARDAAAAALQRPGVASFLLTWSDCEALSERFSQTLRGRRLIYDSEPLEPDEVAFAVVLESVGAALCASVWVDYRQLFGYDRLLGSARGVADVNLPADFLAAVALLRRQLRVAKQKSDFWSWKAQQGKVNPVEPSAEMIFSSWLEAADLNRCGFSGATPLGAGLGCSFWQRWVANPGSRRRAGGGGTIGGNGKGCPALVVLLPHADGIHVQALLPPAAIGRLCATRSCSVYYP